MRLVSALLPTNVLTLDISQTFHLKFNKDSIESVAVGSFCYVSVCLSGKWQKSSGTSRRCGCEEDGELDRDPTQHLQGEDNNVA